MENSPVARRLLVAIFCLFLASVSAQPKEPDEEQEPSYPRFTLGGQVQLQLDDGSLKATSANSRAPVRNGIGSFPIDSRLYPRRIRVYPRLYFNDQWSLINETDLDPDGLEPEELQLTILDLYLKYKYAEGHDLRLGQSKVPFGYEFLRSSRTLTVVERSDASRMLFQRDIGLSAFGKHKKLEYGVGVFQGQGQNTRERNGTNDVAARVAYQVFPDLKLGISGQLGTFRPERGADDFAVRRAGIEALYTRGPFTLETEYLFGDGYNLFSEDETAAQGYLLYGIYRVRDELDLVLGYDRFDPDIAAVNNSRSDGGANDRDRYTLGLNYYFSREPIHKIMLNYEWRNELEGPSVNSQGFRLRYQYSW